MFLTSNDSSPPPKGPNEAHKFFVATNSQIYHGVESNDDDNPNSFPRKLVSGSLGERVEKSSVASRRP